MAMMGKERQAIRFGNVDSTDYDIYISGEGVFNAPKRATEMVSVPGRNGAVAIDQGYWENIEVTYPAVYVGSDLDNFSAYIREFRNALASQIGYQRLEDTIHTSEYRMAMYVDGFEATPIKHNTAAEFELKFECKPQRWLTSGESAVTIANNDVLMNPTLYGSGPLLAVEGYGTVGFNGYTIELENALMGNVTLAESGTFYTYIKGQNPARRYYEDGDTITVTGAQMVLIVYDALVNSVDSISDSNSSLVTTVGDVPSHSARYTMNFEPVTFTAGTYETKTNTVTATVTRYDNTTATYSFSVSIEYSNYSTYTDNIRYTLPTVVNSSTSLTQQITTGTVVVNSSVSILGNPTYIDCDIGECYLINSGQIVDLNAYIDLGSDLPTLASGSNTVTYDNTVTDLKITPRWWQL